MLVDDWCSQRAAIRHFALFFFVDDWCCFFLLTRYGDMPAHNLLWRECEKSSDNVAARLAVIPLVQVMCFTWINIYPISKKLFK